MIKNYNRFSDLPFDGLAKKMNTNPDPSHVKEFALSCGLKHKISWFMPQLVTHISNFNLGSATNISAKLFLQHNMQDPFNQGVYWFCMHPNKSDYLGTQYMEPSVQYCALVPLLLMPFKKLRNIDYSAWNRNELRHLLEPKLWEAISTPVPNLSREEWLQFRVNGLVIRTGKQAGQNRNPTSSYVISGSPVSESTAINYVMPRLQAIMKTQIWCAHPANRHKYMILDPVNLDLMPEPLISTDVLVKQEVEENTGRLPWDFE